MQAVIARREATKQSTLFSLCSYDGLLRCARNDGSRNDGSTTSFSGCSFSQTLRKSLADFRTARRFKSLAAFGAGRRTLRGPAGRGGGKPADGGSRSDVHPAEMGDGGLGDSVVSAADADGKPAHPA